MRNERLQKKKEVLIRIEDHFHRVVTKSDFMIENDSFIIHLFHHKSVEVRTDAIAFLFNILQYHIRLQGQHKRIVLGEGK